MKIIVVFDAQLVPGVTQSYTKYQLEVIFTEEGETADSYIERIAGELNNRLTQVTVATSDLAEQWVIFSQGALRTSARNCTKAWKKRKKTSTSIKPTCGLKISDAIPLGHLNN